MATAVRWAGEAGEGRLELLAIPYGGPFAGQDSYGEHFSERTNLCLDWFPDDRPLLFHHGLDAGPGLEAVGRVLGSTVRRAVDGVWVQAQLDRHHRYFDSIKELIDRGALYCSSGAMAHLVEVDARTGEILVWPWVEASLTPTPANPLARVTPAEAARRFKAAGIPVVGAGSWALGGRGVATETPAGLELGRDADRIPAGGGGHRAEGSYEDLIADLDELVGDDTIARRLGLPDGGRRWVVGTFGLTGPGYCVVRCVADATTFDLADNDGPAYYRLGYTLDERGEPVPGAVTPLQKIYVPRGGKAWWFAGVTHAAVRGLCGLDATVARLVAQGDRLAGRAVPATPEELAGVRAFVRDLARARAVLRALARAAGRAGALGGGKKAARRRRAWVRAEVRSAARTALAVRQLLRAGLFGHPVPEEARAALRRLKVERLKPRVAHARAGRGDVDGATA